jgi:hypothetical protein
MEKKQIVTNSLLSTLGHCTMAYYWRYVKALVPDRTSKTLKYGELYHLLMESLYKTGNSDSFKNICRTWLDTQVAIAKNTARELQHSYGIYDEEHVRSITEDATNIAKKCYFLAIYYRDNVWIKHKDRFEVIFVEQTFNVPVLTSAGHRHPTLRYCGKWDLVLKDNETGKVWIVDHKTTGRKPVEFAALAQLDTQPIGYTYAAWYLASDIKKTEEDSPLWPEIESPSGFKINVVRKKVPQKPRLLKSGDRLSKAISDTTHELYMEAIKENELNPKHYEDILRKLKARGPMFHVEEIINLDRSDIEKWNKELLIAMRVARRVEKGERFRCSAWGCQSFYGRKCSYWPLCYTDEEKALGRYKVVKPHNELED